MAAQRNIKAAIALLDWLTAHGLTLANARQGDLDAWLASAQASHRTDAGNFVRWARKQKLTTMDFAATRWGGPAGVIDTEARWEQARRLLHDDTLKPEDRVAGLLVLLYAQWPATISRLTISHIQTSGRPGPDPARPRASRPARAPRRPCPAGRGHPARPRRHRRPGYLALAVPRRAARTADQRLPLAERLRQLGLHPGQARSTALFQLATDLPAAVLARMLGIHISVAVAWQRASAGVRVRPHVSVGVRPDVWFAGGLAG